MSSQLHTVHLVTFCQFLVQCVHQFRIYLVSLPRCQTIKQLLKSDLKGFPVHIDSVREGDGQLLVGGISQGLSVQ